MKALLPQLMVTQVSHLGIQLKVHIQIVQFVFAEPVLIGKGEEVGMKLCKRENLIVICIQVVEEAVHHGITQFTYMLIRRSLQ